jgi:hypothetical protein
MIYQNNIPHYYIERMELQTIAMISLPLFVSTLPWLTMWYTNYLANQTYENLRRLHAKII